MDLEKLIQLVRERELIYNYNHKNYHDMQKKEAIWKAIGKKLNQSGKDCKRQWTALRDSFRRNLKKRKLSNETITPYSKKWKYEEEMSFIQPYLKERPVVAPQDISLSSDDDSDPAADVDENATSLHQLESTKDTTRIKNWEEKSISEAMIKYLLENKKDEIETLFCSLAQTVKRMSPYYQALAKARVCSIVSELELENLAQQTKTEPVYTSISTSIPSPTVSHSSINIASPISSPQASSSHGLSTQSNSEMPDIKPF